MRELIDELKKINMKLDADQQEFSDLCKKHGFGSIAWQDAMVARIKQKLTNNQQLSYDDTLFIRTQMMHNARLMDELKACGLEKFDTN